MVKRNSYQFDKDLEDWELTLCAVVHACIGFLSISGNLLTLIMFRIRPSLLTKRTVTLASVAVADFLVGLDSLAYTVQFALGQNWYYYTDSMEKLHLNIIGMAVFASQMFPTATAGLHLILLTMERHASIVSPLKYRTKFTKKRAVISIIVAWLIGFLIIFGNFIMVSIAYATGNVRLVLVGREYNSFYTVFCIGWIYLVVTVDLITLYVVMLYKSWKQKSERQHLSSATSEMRASQRHKSIMQIFFVLTFYHSFSWGPFVIASVYSQLSSNLTVYRSIFYSSFLGLTNSFVNAFVYAAKNNDFREAFKCILKGDWRVKTAGQGFPSVGSISGKTSSKTVPNSY